MMLGKNVQISGDFFLDLCIYFFDDDAPEGYAADEIRKHLLDKIDKLITRELFTHYKRTPTGEEREKARREYLERVGVSKSFISDVEVSLFPR